MDNESAQKLAKAIFDSDSILESIGFPQIEGYELIREIGRGGAGTVYEGIVSATGRRVAVKILHMQSSKPAAHALYELDRLASVRSQVVPHVFEHGWIDGRMYIVTEFIDGVDPLVYTKGESVRAKVELLVKIADAVGILNSRGIIHRDLKPSNLLITDDGSPVIIDLGISVMLGSNSDDALYKTPGVTGTIAYMSPEQARGEIEEVSTRWDVYAVGAIAYQILTGSTPYGRMKSASDSLKLIGTTEPRPPRSLCKDLPKGLSYVLSKACAFDAECRYETVHLLRDDLQRWLSHEPVLAGPQTFKIKALRLITRHPVVTSLLTICVSMFVLSMIATTGVVLWQNVQPFQFEYGSEKWVSRTSIQSRSGRDLHTWETKSETGIRYKGRILDSGSGKIAIVGLNDKDIKSGHLGLVGYRLGNYEQPAWIARQEVPLLFQSDSLNGPDIFNFVFLFLDVVDIYPDHSGLEIVSVHRHKLYSVCAIQIHSADGVLLSEYYHDGQVQDIHWNPAHRQLVCAAVNSDGDWISRGAATNGVSTYPFVFFAIVPEEGAGGQIVRHPGLEIGVDPEWYRCLLPKAAYSLLGTSPWKKITVEEPNLVKNQHDGLVAIQLGGQGVAGNVHVTLLVDEQGQVISRRATDSWSEIHGGADPELFRIGDMPMRAESKKLGP